MAKHARIPEDEDRSRNLDRVAGAAAKVAGITHAAPTFRVRSAARKSPAVRRRLMLALAAADEELMTRHARAAADFVRETAEELPFDRALSIYFRLVNVPSRDRRTVAVRALARIGDSMPPNRIPSDPDERDRLIDRILRRVRGRQDSRLRAWVGVAATRARVSAHRAHLDGARQVADALDGVVEPAEAIQYYIEAMDIQPGWAEQIFHSGLGPHASGGKAGSAAD